MLVTAVVLLAIFAMLIAYAVRCAWDISMSLPVGQWVSFDEVLKVGYHYIPTACILDILREIGTVSTKFVGTEEEREDVKLYGLDVITPEGDEPTYHIGYPELFEYMLHRRPRRRRRIQELRRKSDSAWAPAQI